MTHNPARTPDDGPADAAFEDWIRRMIRARLAAERAETWREGEPLWPLVPQSVTQSSHNTRRPETALDARRTLR